MSPHPLETEFACTLTALAPFGLEIRAQTAAAALAELPRDQLRSLVLTRRLLLFRGFTGFDEPEAFAGLCREWGELLAWDFGTVFEVAEHADPQNYLFTSGSVPYHWDGAFAAKVPWLQYFHCREAPGSGVGGETIFCDTAAAWQSLPPETRDAWSAVEIEYFTDKVAHYGGRIRAPLLGRHPHTGESVLRFAEPANATTAPLNTPQLQVQGMDAGSVPAFLRDLTKLVYDPKFVYAHQWQPGDFLIADNHVLLHGRHCYGERLPRRLWRVHVL